MKKLNLMMIAMTLMIGNLSGQFMRWDVKNDTCFIFSEDDIRHHREVGISALISSGFVPSPFKSSWFGEYINEIQGYIYEFCRVSKNNHLEWIEIQILRDDAYIKILMNIFEIHPEIKSVHLLNNYDGINFKLPPNNLTQIRLRSDDYSMPPIVYMLFLPEHKIGCYYTKSGYDSELKKLKKLIKSDLENIEYFIQRWNKLHKPNITDCEGNPIN